MNNKVAIFVVVVVVVAVALAGYMFFKKGEVEELPADTTPSLGENTSTNPMDNKPDLNPAGQSNPFRSIKTNPFE